MADIEQGQPDEGQDPNPQSDGGDDENKGDATISYLGREMTAEQLLDETRKKDAELTRLYQERKANTQEDTPSNKEAELDDQLKEAQRVLNELGYVDKKSVKELLNEELQNRELQNRVQSQVEVLGSKYNGKGDFKDYPVFDELEVREYGAKRNIFDLDAAYQSLHKGKILDAEIKRAEAKKAAEGDKSDAPKDEPIDKETLNKKITEAGGSSTKIAQILQEAGLAKPPGS